jgi:ribulose kinase
MQEHCRGICCWSQRYRDISRLSASVHRAIRDIADKAKENTVRIAMVTIDATFSTSAIIGRAELLALSGI